MKSLVELQTLAALHDIPLGDPSATVLKTREQLMDDLRAKIGTFDPDLQIDPAKAQDLKNKIAWGSENPFAGIITATRKKFEAAFCDGSVRVISEATDPKTLWLLFQINDRTPIDYDAIK